MAKKKTAKKVESRGPSSEEFQERLDEAREENRVMREEMSKLEASVGWYQRQRAMGRRVRG